MLKFSHKTLLISAGVMWIAVGIMLVIRAGSWIFGINLTTASALVIAGMLVGLLFYWKIFSAVTDKYIGRINFLPEKAFIWACFAPRSWLLITAMSVMGVFLRNSSIPKLFLIVPYLMMAFGLVAGGFKFLKNSNNR
jgi:hypothetical protein